MTVLASSLAIAAGLLHVAIFAMESLFWSRPAVYRRFGVTSAEAAEANRLLMFNQGFYNLFLGIGAIVGAVLVLVRHAAGWPVLMFACVCMAGAALVLATCGARYARPAAMQGTLPALALVAAGLAAL